MNRHFIKLLFYFCSASKDWLPVGKDLAVMCTECRLYYKKHGELRPVDSKDNLPFLFQPVKEEDNVNGKHVMRTRRSKEVIYINKYIFPNFCFQIYFIYLLLCNFC